MPGAKAALLPFARFFAWRFDRAEARTLERQSRHDEAAPHHRIADALGVE